MGEMVTEAKVLLVNMVCDKCGNGFMKMTNTNGIFETKYTHKCNNCGYEANYDILYPYQKLVPIEPLREMREDEVNYGR